MHGGAKGSGAPTGERNGRYRHGRFTKIAVKRHREVMAELRELERLGKSIGMFG